jgi:3-hydroxyacyl-[acyl-carrier-protein] dehydratase
MLINDFFKIRKREKEGETISYQLKIDKNHAIFEGHFPGQPVVPGVCLTQIIKELIEQETNVQLQLTKGSNLKFMAVVDPQKNDELTYQLQFNQSEDQINASASAMMGDITAFKFKGSFKIN